MITTLDTQPQEWMEGDEKVFHTVAACHFENIEHIEHWINKLIPRNQSGNLVKWSGGKRKSHTREYCDKRTNQRHPDGHSQVTHFIRAYRDAFVRHPDNLLKIKLEFTQPAQFLPKAFRHTLEDR